MKKIMPLLAAFMLFGSVGAFASKFSIQPIEQKVENQTNEHALTQVITNALVKPLSYTSSCGDTWECTNCPNYTPTQWIIVTITLESLCGFPDVDSILITFP